MIKLTYLIAIVWYSGPGNQKYASTVNTFTFSADCERAIPFVREIIEERFPGNKFYLGCEDVLLVDPVLATPVI